MDNMIAKLVWHHFASQHGVVTLVAVLLARFDYVIKLALTIFPPTKLKAMVDWVSAWLDKRIDQDAQPPAQPPASGQPPVQPRP